MPERAAGGVLRMEHAAGETTEPLAVTYSPGRCPAKYHRRCQA